MKRMFFVLFLGIIILSACMSPAAATTPAPVQTDVPVLPSETAPALPTDTVPAPTEAVPNPKLPASSFESQPYINEAAGFALDIPSGWTVNEMVVGDRGTQIQFLSSPDLAEAPVVPEGGTRVNAVLYQWDPKNDLAAFVAQQKTAWESSGITILEEEQVVLELGLPAVRFHVQAPDADLIFLMAALGDQYLVLSGEGDLELVNEIVGRLRPIS